MLLSKIGMWYIHAGGKRTFRKLEKATRNPLAYNTEFLLAQLKKNADTEFGIKHNFKDIDSLEKFKAAVPLAVYDDYSEYIDRMKKGESNILSKKDPMCYAQTSGSIGNPKLIPVSGEAVGVIMKNEFMFNFLTESLYKNAGVGTERALFMVSYVDVKTLPSGVKTGDIGGADARKVSFRECETGVSIEEIMNLIGKNAT